MIWHPLAIAIIWVDGMALVLAALAAIKALQIVADWQPESASRRQLRLETDAVFAALQMRWAALCNGLASLLLLLGIALVFPATIPGAMCGTGVLEAFGRFGWSALALRLAAFGLLYPLGVIHRLNEAAPTAPLSRSYARGVLLAAPLVYLAGLYTIRALLQVDPQAPVNCCTVVYAQMSGGGKTLLPLAAVPAAFWKTAFTAGAAGLLFLTARIYLCRTRPLGGSCRLLVLFMLLWVPAAAVTLVTVLSPYHYQVLRHHCPWCFFLPDHHGRGFFLFGTLLLAAMEAAAALASDTVATAHPPLAATALRRRRLAAGHILLALIGFILLSLAPAAVWRLRYGVWLGS